jgi:hypothetical protein
MAKVEALAPKFRRVETAIRKVLQDFTGVTEVIDSTLGGKRTKAEIALLKKLREENGALHRSAQSLLFRLYEGTQK